MFRMKLKIINAMLESSQEVGSDRFLLRRAKGPPKMLGYVLITNRVRPVYRSMYYYEYNYYNCISLARALEPGRA